MWRARRLWLRLLATLRSGHADADLAREIDAHLGLLEDDYRSRGYAPEQARRAARIALGGADQVKERQRDARSFRWLEDLRRDVPYAVRSLSRTPGAAIAAILTLALGIGTTTAIFTLFDGVLLEPLPVNRPDELRVVRQLMRFGGRIEKSGTYLPYGLFAQLQQRSDVFSSTIAFAGLRDAVLAANGRDRALPAGGVFVSDNYFAVLGVTAALGRTFGPGEGEGVEPAAVLSHACWLREFGGDRSVIGRPIRINGAAFTIVGVAPPRFFGLVLGEMPDVFLPIESLAAAQPALSALADRANWRVQIGGRLQPTVTDAVAADRLTVFHRSVLPPAPGQANWQVDALPIETGLSDVRERFARPLSILLGMGALLLLVACANVATLLGARASSRRPELVIRTAIGAGRGRLLRQLATESLVLAVVAGAAGVVFASWATRVLFGLMPQGSTPLLLDVAIDRRVLAFSMAISIVTAIIAGVVPALRAVGFDLAAALRDRSHGGERSAGRARSFAVVQVAMCVVLVIASAMFARTLHTLTTIDPGFRPDGLFQVTVEPGARLIRGPRLEQFYRDAFERLRAVPGVRAVTSSQMPLLDHGQTTGTIAVPGFQPSSDDDRMALMFQVGPAFFGATGIAVVRGRDFTEQDVAGAQRVAAINEEAARRFFGTRDPIGGTVSSDGGYQIVAVVQSAKYNTLRDQDRAVMFVPYTTVRQRPRMTLLVRADGQSEPPAAAMAAAARGGDPLIPIEITPTTVLVDRSLAQERLLALLSMFFAVAALVLLSVSLYGIMSFWVAERAAEIGIHLALGARLSHIRWVVIRQPLWLAGLGIGIGVPAAVAASRAVDSLMFGVGPRDPLTIAGAVLLILVVTVAACIPPARRAARVDPMTALRCE